MEVIKGEFKNSETQIEALELIEQHKDEISPYAFLLLKISGYFSQEPMLSFLFSFSQKLFEFAFKRWNFSF
ncbi:MAG: hypothetical protein KAT65_18635, partial [Methanophagales archaeon]|nr:hypothetical protein [Methanophagales archaeon]